MTIYSFPMTAPVSPNGVRREMDRLMNDVFGAVRPGQGTFTPATATEDASGYTLEVELAGVSPESVDVVAEDGVLMVRGEKPAPQRNGESRTLFAERAFGAFERRFRLPKAADLGAIEAGLANGLLTVRVAKIAPAQPRRVQINVDRGPVRSENAVTDGAQ